MGAGTVRTRVGVGSKVGVRCSGFGLRSMLGVLLLGCCVWCCGLVFVGGAFGFSFSRQFNGAETPLGEFSHPQGLAVDSSGDVFVADFFGKAIDRYGPLGVYESRITGVETPPGEFGEPGEEIFEPRDIALDAAGDVFAAVPFRKAVEEFDSTGKFVGRITTILNASSEPEELVTPQAVAVDTTGDVSDPSNGDLYIVDSGVPAVDKLSAVGVFISQLPGSETPTGAFLNPLGVAVGGAGEVYVADRSAHVIDRFSAAGKYESGISEANVPVGLRGSGLFSPIAVALDAAGDVLVSDGTNHVIDEFDPAGVFLHQISQVPAGAPVEGPFGEVRALAFDPAGNLYAADATNQVVDVFAPTNPPEATLGAASEAEATTGAGAVLHGTVNPNGASVTSCEFQYGTTTSYGQSTPCATTGNTPIGSGSAPVPVVAHIEGLLPNTVYHFRLVAETEHGPGESPDGHFTSGTLTPIPGEIQATGITQFTATLSGALDTRNAPASYHFAYGTSTTYTSIAPSPDLVLPAAEGTQALTPQAITGLQPATTYHYALVTTGPGGTRTGADHTFETPPIPQPLLATGSASGITETTATLNGSIDPQGWETVYTFQYGTTTSYGQSWPTTQIALGSLNGAQAVTVHLERLQPNTTYHYRLIATNPGHTEYTNDQVFTTTSYLTTTIQETPSTNKPYGLNPNTKQPTPKPHKKTRKKTHHKTTHKKHK